jgi:hypothetical protein
LVGDSTFIAPAAAAVVSLAVVVVAVVVVVVVAALALVGEGAGEEAVRSTTIGAGAAAAATAAAAAAAAVIGATVHEGPLTKGWPRADLRGHAVRRCIDAVRCCATLCDAILMLRDSIPVLSES